MKKIVEEKKTLVTFASMLHMRYYIMTILILIENVHTGRHIQYISIESVNFQHVDFELNFLLGEKNFKNTSATGDPFLTHC